MLSAEEILERSVAQKAANDLAREAAQWARENLPDTYNEGEIEYVARYGVVRICWACEVDSQTGRPGITRSEWIGRADAPSAGRAARARRLTVGVPASESGGKDRERFGYQLAEQIAEQMNSQ